MRCCIGIDLAKRKHSAAVIAQGGERLLVGFEFRNDGEGFESLLAKLSEVGAEGRGSGVCLEATGHYGRNLIAFLEAHGYEVFEVNPLLTANWRKAMSVRKVKNDAVDAEALALWLLAGNPTRRRQSKSETDDLRSLARSRTSLSHIVGDCKRKSQAIADVVFPEFHGFFADDFGKAGTAVLSKWGSAANVASARVDSIEKAIREASSGRFGRADAERLKALAKSSVGQHSGPLVFQLRLCCSPRSSSRGARWPSSTGNSRAWSTARRSSPSPASAPCAPPAYSARSATCRASGAPRSWSPSRAATRRCSNPVSSRARAPTSPSEARPT